MNKRYKGEALSREIRRKPQKTIPVSEDLRKHKIQPGTQGNKIKIRLLD